MADPKLVYLDESTDPATVVDVVSVFAGVDSGHVPVNEVRMGTELSIQTFQNDSAALIKTDSDEPRLHVDNDGERVGDEFTGDVEAFGSTSEADVAATRLGENNGGGALLGTSVGVSGSTGITGGHGQFGGGKIYIWNNSGSAWSEQYTATGDTNGDDLGSAVAIDGDYAVAGATQEDIGNGNSGNGYVRVYLRTGTSWSPQQTITGSTSGGEFGYSVDIRGDRLIIGERGTGKAYIYVRSGTDWDLEGTFSQESSSSDFGWSVSIDDDYAVVGAPLASPNGTDSGEAYVYVRSGSDWDTTVQVTFGGEAANWLVGDSVSISGDTIALGSYNQSRVDLYTRSGTTWPLEETITGSSDINFGSAVSIRDDSLAIGADSNGPTYVYTRSGTDWSQATSFNGTTNTGYGASVAIDTASLVIGAPNDSSFEDTFGDFHADSGKVYFQTWTAATDGLTFLKSEFPDLDLVDFPGPRSIIFPEPETASADLEFLNFTNTSGSIVFTTAPNNISDDTVVQITRSGSTWTTIIDGTSTVQTAPSGDSFSFDGWEFDVSDADDPEDQTWTFVWEDEPSPDGDESADFSGFTERYDKDTDRVEEQPFSSSTNWRYDDVAVGFHQSQPSAGAIIYPSDDVNNGSYDEFAYRAGTGFHFGNSRTQRGITRGIYIPASVETTGRRRLASSGEGISNTMVYDISKAIGSNSDNSLTLINGVIQDPADDIDDFSGTITFDDFLLPTFTSGSQTVVVPTETEIVLTDQNETEFEISRDQLTSFVDDLAEVTFSDSTTFNEIITRKIADFDKVRNIVPNFSDTSETFVFDLTDGILQDTTDSVVDALTNGIEVKFDIIE